MLGPWVGAKKKRIYVLATPSYVAASIVPCPPQQSNRLNLLRHQSTALESRRSPKKKTRIRVLATPSSVAASTVPSPPQQIKSSAPWKCGPGRPLVKAVSVPPDRDILSNCIFQPKISEINNSKLIRIKNVKLLCTLKVISTWLIPSAPAWIKAARGPTRGNVFAVQTPWSEIGFQLN